MENGKDYCVEVRASFLLNTDGSGEHGAAAFSDAQQVFAQHVEHVFARDEALWNNTIGDMEVQSDGLKAQIRYLFASRGEDKAKAERFSADCIRNVQKELEVFGCKLEKLECAAEEVVPEWRDQPKKAKPPTPKKGRPTQVR